MEDEASNFVFFFFFEQAQLPFAVIGSREEVEVGGKKVRARKYPWGTVEGTAVHTHVHVSIHACFDLVSLSLFPFLFFLLPSLYLQLRMKLIVILQSFVKCF